MELVVRREILTDKSTIGELIANDNHVCWTLEDVVRPVGVDKVYGRTAIPVGRYRVEISFSEHFQKSLPILLDVKDFTGVRIHSGNSAADTEGCLLLGLTRGTDFIGESRKAFELFYPMLQAALQEGQEVWLEVRNP